MHSKAQDSELIDAIVRYAVERITLAPPPLDGPASSAELRARIGQTILPDGIGGLAALRLFAEELAPACISADHPRYLAFVPAAPTQASILFDLIVGASSVYAGSWLEGAGAIYAENEALGWLASLAGFPEKAGGVFVSGGTAGNLNALATARWAWRSRDPSKQKQTALIMASERAHSSIAQAARILDADHFPVGVDDSGRMTGAALAAAIDQLDPSRRSRLFAVVATAGTTNAGKVDDLSAIAEVCAGEGLWMHVDGAYGAAALASPSLRPLFAGIEKADSLIVDPHKWLFAPYDACALIYRDPSLAKAAHTQHADYLDPLQASDGWNASDYAHLLSRRARGLPLWFSLATHGTRSYAEAIESTVATAHQAARAIDEAAHLELLMDPTLSVVLFRRQGWNQADYDRWSEAQLEAETMFVVPTKWQGEPVLRICIVNPLTTMSDIGVLISSLEAPPG